MGNKLSKSYALIRKSKNDYQNRIQKNKKEYNDRTRG